jgi:hypothetical protein
MGPGRGLSRTITEARVEEVVVRTLEEVPEGGTHWPERELARRMGISPTSVHRPTDALTVRSASIRPAWDR